MQCIGYFTSFYGLIPQKLGELPMDLNKMDPSKETQINHLKDKKIKKKKKSTPKKHGLRCASLSPWPCMGASTPCSAPGINQCRGVRPASARRSPIAHRPYELRLSSPSATCEVLTARPNPLSPLMSSTPYPSLTLVGENFLDPTRVPQYFILIQ